MSNLNVEKTDNVYYNAVITNPADSGKLIPMEFAQDHNQPILLDPSQYEMCVVRFNIPGNTPPLLFFKNNYYSVTLSYGGDNYRTYLQYIPVNNPGFEPYTQPIFYYYQMINAFNIAFTTSFNALKAAHPVGTPDYPPVLMFDRGSQLFSFVVPRTYDPSVGATISVYLNYQAALLFETVPFYSYSYSDVDGKDSMLIVTESLNNYYPVPTDPTVDFVTPGGTYPALQITGFYPYFRQWNQLKSIVLTTQTIPCRREILALEGANNTSYISMVTDFTPQVNNNSDVLATFYFFPQGPYRLIDLVESVPMYRFDFKIYWTTFDGGFYPLYLSPGNEANIKFLFMKKSIRQFINSGSL